MDILEFPTYFVEGEDKCPPKEARIEEKLVYRMVDRPMSEEDFKSYYELKKPIRNSQCRCQKFGISVFSDFRDIIKTQNSVPALRSKLIAKGYTKIDFGKILETPGKNKSNSHITWWLYANVLPHLYFKLMEVD